MNADIFTSLEVWFVVGSQHLYGPEALKQVAEDGSGLNAEPSFFRGSRLPVEQVSWVDCQNWLLELNTSKSTRRIRLT